MTTARLKNGGVTEEKLGGGKVAIGGGAKVIGGTGVALTDSGPLPPNADGKRIGWDAAAREIAADASDWHLDVYVVCVSL